MLCSRCSAEMPDGCLACSVCGEPISTVPPEESTVKSSRTIGDHPWLHVVRGSSNRNEIITATVWTRCLCAQLDLVAISLIAFLFPEFRIHGLLGWEWWVCFMIYYIACEGLFGATPAKMLFHIKVIKRDGTHCTFLAAIIRTFARVADYLFLAGIPIMMLSNGKQRLGDMLADTIVVRKRAA